VNSKLLRYAITDRFGTSSGRQNSVAADPRPILLRQAAQLAAGGTDFLQLREKDLPAGELADLARGLLDALQHSATKLLINSRADIAVATGAHGVHLTSSAEELTPRQVHEIYAVAKLAPPLVTVSCHTLAEVLRHRFEPVTAILFGPVFEKVASRETRLEGMGLDLLRQACLLATPIPVLALGGVTGENMASCMEAGAGGVAGIRLFSREETLCLVP
jgi:thiamine-phosphate pyrophosphorylase